MNKEVAKRAFEDAQKELDNGKVEKLKKLVKDTLERIAEIDDKIKELNEEKRLLKLDIDDLKEGRLDRIEERQKTDEKAKKVSRIIVERIEVTTYPAVRYIDIPYHVYPNNTFYCTSNTNSDFAYVSYTDAVNALSCTLTGGITKQHTSGAYELEHNHGVTHLR